SGLKNRTHGLYRKKELAFIAGFLPISLFAQPTTGYDAVQVWVQGELLTPRMQNADHSGLRAQVLWVMPKRVECAPGCRKEAVVNSLWIIHSKLVELRWKGKNHMEIR